MTLRVQKIGVYYLIKYEKFWIRIYPSIVPEMYNHVFFKVIMIMIKIMIIKKFQFNRLRNRLDRKLV